MRMQGAIQRVQLLSRRGPDSECQTQIIAGLAGAHFHGGGIEIGVELQYDFSQDSRQIGMGAAHDLDWKVAGVLDQAVFGRDNCIQGNVLSTGLVNASSSSSYSRLKAL